MSKERNGATMTVEPKVSASQSARQQDADTDNFREETAEGMRAYRVGWKETRSSVFGEGFVCQEVCIERSEYAGIEAETVSLHTHPARAEAADLEAVFCFEAGSGIPADGGRVHFVLTARNIPVGCKVAFCSEDTTPPINLPWTTINHPNIFVAGTYAQLPAGFKAPIALKLSAEGKALPPSVERRSLTLCAILMPKDDTADGHGVDIEASHDGSGADAEELLVRGKLLGKATVNL